jgi:hypothetical protein
MPSNFYSNGPAQQPVNQRFIEGARNIWDSFTSLPNNISWNKPEKSPEQIESEQGLISFFEKNKLRKQREEELGRPLNLQEWLNTEPPEKRYQQSFMSQPVSPEIQKQIEAAKASEVDQEAFQNEAGGTYDGSGNLLDALKAPEEPPQPTPYQSSRDDIGILSFFKQNQEEDSVLKERGKGVLGQIGDIFGNLFDTEDPNFRDNLVIGLGSLGARDANENALTRQAMGNIETRNEQALTDANNKRLLEINEANNLNAMQIAALQASSRSPNEFTQALLRKAGADAAEWGSGGRANAINRINVLDDMEVLMQNHNVSGTDVGIGSYLGGNLYYSAFNPEGAIVKDTIEQVLTESLKEILGAQFAEKEGYKFLARGYNVFLSEEENIRRLNYLRRGMKAGVQAKDDLYAYLNNGGNLADYNGPTEEEAFNNIMSDTSLDTDYSSIKWSDNPLKSYLLENNVNEETWNAIVSSGMADEFVGEYYRQQSPE